MKHIAKLFVATLLLGSLFTLSSCDNEPSASNISRVTYFPNFEYEGGDLNFVQCGSSYSLPPIKATENGVELPVSTTITGVFSGANEFNIDNADKYEITSSATNADGFDGTVTRTVWVVCNGDLTSSIEGLYTSTVVRNGALTPQYTDMKYVLIRKVGEDTYELSDAIGGYYAIGRLYGNAYNATGMTVKVNNLQANDFTFGGPVGVGAFGGSLSMVTMNVNPETRQIYFESDWDQGFYFAVTLTQVEI